MTTPNPTPPTHPSDDDPIVIAKPPWTLTGDFYLLSHWISGAQAANFPSSIAYSPLEAASQFGDAATSRPVGGMAMIQIIRYRESPVGPYDELAILPGTFEWSREGPDGQRTTSRNLKISRMYVSQKHTCYNGRANWNIPKHLARFEWIENPNKSLTVRVFPHDTSTPSDETEATASPTPFLQATLKPAPYVPSFPFNTDWLRYIGVDTKTVLPPLPQGKGSRGELPGTDKWCSILPAITGGSSSLVTVDMSQRDESGECTAEHDNFWPGLGRWHVAIKMANATMTLGPPEETW